MQPTDTPECLPLFGPNAIALKGGKYFLSALLMLIPLGTPAATDNLYIGGSPTTSVAAGTVYKFRPWVAGTNTSHLSFHIADKPAWAAFDATTGSVYGKATAGTYSRIAISVSDGEKTVWTPQWTITVLAAGSAPPTSPPPAPPPSTPDTPKISGSPTTSVAVDAAYNFQPTASDPKGAALTFSINTKPTWASFDKTTGRLSGTPAPANVGATSNIIITASNGKASASLPAFSLTVTQIGTGSATLSWQAPTENANGSALTNLAGYKIEYGNSPSTLTKTIQVANPGLTQYVVSNLSQGTWYFGILAYTSAGSQSNLSAIGHKTIN